MSRNIFGERFRFISWGESHGTAIGAVVDGCPAGVDLDEDYINDELELRRPGKCAFTSQRKETDRVQILSGVFEGKTLGSPISLLIPNVDVDSSYYEDIRDVWRPGHADYTYEQRYGYRDWRGGGRASARETATRVAVSAIAKKLLKKYNISFNAVVKSIGGVEDEFARQKLLDKVASDGDSVGGIVELVVQGVPSGWGDPVYGRLDAALASAMLSIPASTSFEIGDGILSAHMRGSEYNDVFIEKEGKITTMTNHCGGILGGISTGGDIVLRVAFKPTPSISKVQKTMSRDGRQCDLVLPNNFRYDACIAIRAAKVVEAMAALVLADFSLSR